MCSCWPHWPSGGGSPISQETAVEQLVSLFAADGITLDPDVISDETPPSSRSLTRSTDLERRAAALLLGSSLSSSDQGGGISSYSSNRGAVQFRSGGSFDASGTLCQEDPTGFCQDFCREFGYSKPVFQLDTTGSGTGTAVFLCDGLSVYNCTLTFTFTEGVLTSVSGILLPQTYTELASDVEPLSASARPDRLSESPAGNQRRGLLHHRLGPVSGVTKLLHNLHVPDSRMVHRDQHRRILCELFHRSCYIRWNLINFSCFLTFSGKPGRNDLQFLPGHAIIGPQRLMPLSLRCSFLPGNPCARRRCGLAGVTSFVPPWVCFLAAGVNCPYYHWSVAGSKPIQKNLFL